MIGRRAVAAGLGVLAAGGWAVRAADRPAPDGALKTTPDGRPLVLTFEDEFTTFRRFAGGQGIWRTTFRDGNGQDAFDLRTLRWNKELQLYVDPDFAGLGLDPFSVKDGTLEIAARPAPKGVSALGGFAYVSGLITTQPSFSQTYGYFEIRARLPRGKGVWPAFWLLPLDLSWPPEIDVMESIGDPAKVYVTAHSASGKAQGVEVAVAPEGFHTFAVAWDRERLTWFVDGRQVEQRPTPPDLHKPMYMLANVALGGDWAGAPDATTPFPAVLSIDRIRAYRFAA